MNYNGLTPEEVLAIAIKKISGLKSIVSYKGVTTTALTDGSTTNPIIIEGSSYTATNGDCVLYEGIYYTWNGTLWQESLSFAEVITALEDLNDKVDDILDGTSIDSFKDTEDALDAKVDKVEGKGLSTNDYTDEDKAIVDGVTGALAEKADTDDIPALVNANFAKGVKGNETVQSTDKVPFISKQMGVGAYQRKKFVGGSFVKNQNIIWSRLGGVIQNGISASFDSTTNILTYTCNVTSNSSYNCPYFNYFLGNHTYIFIVDVKEVTSPSSDINITFGTNYTNATLNVSSAGVKQKVLRYSSNTQNALFGLFVNNAKDITVVIKMTGYLIDLTQMFGAEIADYAYSLEQAEEGSGIAWLKSYGFFTKDYYAYDAGSIQSVCVSEYSVTGKNLVNLSKSYVSYGSNMYTSPYQGAEIVISGDTITLDKSHASASTGLVIDLGYLAKGTYTVSAVAFGGLRLYKSLVPLENGANHGTKIIDDLSNNPTFIVDNSGYYYLYYYVGTSSSPSFTKLQVEFGSTSTEYEPYHKTTYPLTPTELRGVPRIDANNNIYCDGDEYASDGEVTRKYDIVDLGELTWTMLTSGRHSATVSGAKIVGNTQVANAITTKYFVTSGTSVGDYDMSFSLGLNNQPAIVINDSTLNNASAEDFKTAMSGVYLVYELATPTTETLTPFDFPQAVGSIEEITDYKVEQETRDVAIPTGHVTEYMGAGGEFSLPTLPDSPSVLAYDGHNFYWKTETTNNP